MVMMNENENTVQPRYAMGRVGQAGYNIAALRALLYSNYRLLGMAFADPMDPTVFIIAGVDSAGFTLEAQLDRMASALIFAEEVSAVRVTHYIDNLVEV